jgi:hypothetical protein
LTTLEGVKDVVVHTEPARAQSQVIPDEVLRRSVEAAALASTRGQPRVQEERP